ncbi:MAG TPA: DUF2231 domain-containing protein [Tepidisphaeraceae bacterium]|nr:DUF2231 domain-containing protein [Tepidisphaeraceae bacterium]
MEPLMNLMDQGEKLIGHSLHPAIVALPLGAWAVSNVSDAMGLMTGQPSYDDSARISMAVGLVGAAGAILTGLHDYSYIPRTREPSHSIATRHGIGNAVVSTLFVASYVLRVRSNQAGRRPGVVARALACAGGCLMLYTSWLGGKLVEEQGEAVKPIIKEQNEQAKKDEQAKRNLAGAPG